MTEKPSQQHLDDNARLRAVLDTAVDGILTIDDQGLIEAANPAAEILFGYTVAEMVGHNVNMLMPSPYQEEHDGYLANYARTGERKIIGIGREVVGQKKDGTTFPLYLAVSEVLFGDRRVFTGFVHDLTAVRKAEQQSLLLGRIVEDSLNEIYIFDATTLHFMFVNHGALANIGYTIEEMNQLTPVDIKPEFTREQFLETIAPLQRGEKSILRFDTMHQRKDHSLYNVSIQLQMSRWDDRPAFVASMLDVTEDFRHATELRIRDRAIQAANEGVVIADATKAGHPIVFVNEAFVAMSGYSSTEAVGMGCELICGDSPDLAVTEQMRNAVRAHNEFRATIQCKRRNGELFWNKILITPVRAHNCEVTHIVAVMEDVSERRDAQEKLLQSERLAAIGEMVTGLAHESRNALQRAQACLDMLSLDLEDNPEQLELTEKTRRALTDLYRYYEEVRNYAAPINLERRVTDLSNVWERCWANLEASRFGRDFELHVDESSCCLKCNVDEHRIEQVFRNIFENSLAASPDPGHLRLSCSETTLGNVRALRISLHDNGPGFDSETAAKVFQPFFTTKQKGTGLGLPICKRIVEAHGGRIQLGESDAGANIIVDLPFG